MAISRSVRPSLVARAPRQQRFDWLVTTVKHRKTNSRPADSCCSPKRSWSPSSHGDCAVAPMDAGHQMWLIRDGLVHTVRKWLVYSVGVRCWTLSPISPSHWSRRTPGVPKESDKGTPIRRSRRQATSERNSWGFRPTAVRHRAGTKMKRHRHRLAWVTLKRTENRHPSKPSSTQLVPPLGSSRPPFDTQSDMQGMRKSRLQARLSGRGPAFLKAGLRLVLTPRMRQSLFPLPRRLAEESRWHRLVCQ